MPNRLAHETSPYLQQHATNPVDWYPWSDEALERARREDRPILLSIGYAACHWCHVMAHESFEDESTARLMNERFVNIKVDREERPDLDGIYMQAVQTMTGHGGWPMTVFLTPDGVPFYGGTYFPPDDRHGLPSFTRILQAVSEAWQQRRAEVGRSAEALRELYGSAHLRVEPGADPDRELLARAVQRLESSFDARNGGFGGAPKFPQPMTLELMLRWWARTRSPQALEIVRLSFQRMARGGIFDQVGGGFARYAVDSQWLVPHFEKMLYDNALLARLGVQLWQATKDPEVRRVTEATLDWVVREMTSPAGGFYSSLDADSEGHEGKFYVWESSELDTLLGPDTRLVRAFFGVVEGGNFEGRSILHVPEDPAIVAARLGVDEDRLTSAVSRARRILYDARARRVWPGRDEKVLASWNGLMLRTFAEAARAFAGGRDDYRAVALRSGEFLFREMVRDGRVFRSHKDGRSHIAGYLEDHAALGLGALALYELTFDTVWIERARVMADATMRWFWSEEIGAFFDTASDAEALVTRPRDPTDNATPSGTSLAADLLARLGDLLDDETMRARARQVVATLGEALAMHPLAFGHALCVADMLVHGATELAIVGEPQTDAFRALELVGAKEYVPALVVAGGPPESAPGVALLTGRGSSDGRAIAYLCRGYRCEAPALSPAELREQLLAAR